MIDEIVEAWRINHRITLTVLEAVSAEGMKCTLSTRGGRNVSRQFAHIQNVRTYQLEKRAKPAFKGVKRFETKDEPSKRVLVKVFEDSADRIEKWLREADAGTKGYRTFRPGLPATLGYLVAHESHHRGSILLTLKQCGHAIDANIRAGIWDWNNN